jgi:UDP-N-acetylglucosamine--N-acetylmuramyl-(pentapeptide) pyrophosphoryl-undecaprenol N-acetylglucosamine transferase
MCHLLQGRLTVITPKLVVLAGGGTGGHTVAARVIGDIARSDSCDVVWIGRPDSFEARAAAEGGHRFLPVHLTRPSASVAYARVLHRVRRMLRELRPDLVIATGGWVAAPVAIAAFTLRIPVICHEQTLVPGRATRVLSLVAHETWLTWPGAAQHLHRPKRVVVTGLPLREELRREVSTVDAAAQFGCNTALPRLFVAGGGLGAESLNRFVRENLAALLDQWQIIHQAGGGHGLTTTAAVLEAAREALPEHLRARYVVAEYLSAEQVNAALRCAGLVLGRSGAGFVNEVVQLRVPAVFVPYPHARNDEQTALATAAAQAEPATVVWRDVDVATRGVELVELLRDRATVRGDATVRTVPATDPAAVISARLGKVLGLVAAQR